MTNTQTGTDIDTAASMLVREGYASSDVLAVLDSLIDAGLELDQPDEGYLLTDDEVSLVRVQLNSGQ